MRAIFLIFPYFLLLLCTQFVILFIYLFISRFPGSLLFDFHWFHSVLLVRDAAAAAGKTLFIFLLSLSFAPVAVYFLCSCFSFNSCIHWIWSSNVKAAFSFHSSFSTKTIAFIFVARFDLFIFFARKKNSQINDDRRKRRRRQERKNKHCKMKTHTECRKRRSHIDDDFFVLNSYTFHVFRCNAIFSLVVRIFFSCVLCSIILMVQKNEKKTI